MIVEIPIRLVSEANVSEHWSKGYKRHKHQRNLVIWGLYEKGVPKKLPVQIGLTRIGGRKMDEDNLITAFKYVKDAIAEYFIPGKAPGRADDSSEMTWSYKQEKKIATHSIAIRISFEWPEVTRECSSKQLSVRK